MNGIFFFFAENRAWMSKCLSFLFYQDRDGNSVKTAFVPFIEGVYYISNALLKGTHNINFFMEK